MYQALRHHWPEYLMEGAGLGLFMISACLFATVFWHPLSPVPELIDNPLVRRLCMGVAMGLTAVGIIYSPWGQQSGAHLNPAVTLTFFRLGKVAPWDALFYAVAQFAGGIAGVLLAAVCLGQIIAHPAVNYVATTPGMAGKASPSARSLSSPSCSCGWFFGSRTRRAWPVLPGCSLGRSSPHTSHIPPPFSQFRSNFGSAS